MERQEGVIQDMKKQILSYRKEIIELSMTKRDKLKKKLINQGEDSRLLIPRLDLSKLKREEDDEENDSDNVQENSKAACKQRFIRYNHVEEIGI